MSLRAPLCVPVEVLSAGRRVFRLSRSLGEDGVRLERPAPFDIGRPVRIAFDLPDQSLRLTVRARLALTEEDGEGEHGGRELELIELTPEVRIPIRRYVAQRLRLPF